MVKIVEALVQQSGVIREIAEKTWWPAYGNILSEEQIRYMLSSIYAEEQIKQQMESGSQLYLLAYIDEKAIGFAAFGPRQENPEIYKLHKLYCLPEMQGKGCGRILIDEVEKRAKTAGIHYLELNVNRNNSARQFYEKIGFSIAYEEDIPIGGYWMNDFVMRKILKQEGENE